MKKYFFILVVLFYACVGFSNQSVASGDTLLARCVSSYDFGQLNKTSVKVRPLMPACANMCERQCKSIFSRVVNPKGSRPVELNQDIIYDCITNCQLGLPFQSYFKEAIVKADGTPEIFIRNQSRNDVTCSSSIHSGNISTVNFTEAKVFQGKPFKLRLLHGLPNTIYNCGRKIVKLKPPINSLNPADWNSFRSATDDEAKIRRESNICFNTQYPLNSARQIVPTPGIDPKNASNYSLWNNLTTEQASNKCFWSARNPYFTNTEIFLKDGDELSITYSGQHPWFVIQDMPYSSRKDLYDLYEANKNNDAKKGKILEAWVNSSMIAIMRPNYAEIGHIDFSGAADTTFPFFTGEAVRKKKSDVNYIEALNYNLTQAELSSLPPQVPQLGLSGITLDSFKTVSVITEGSDCDTVEKRMANVAKCRKIVDPGDPGYKFSGVVSNFSQTRALFALKHMDWTFNDNLGGFDVEIDWGGCPLRNGSNLQYAIVDEQRDGNYTGVTVPDRDWSDYPENGFDQGFIGITPNRTGVLAFRIKTPPFSLDLSMGARLVEIEAGRRMGEYNFIVDSYDEAQTFVVVKLLRDYTKMIRDTLFGDRRVTNGVTNEGVVMLLYTNIIRDGNLYAIIYSMLLLFLAFTGLGFIIGTVELNQKELVARTLKFAIVAAITSPMSWRLFADHFLYAFIDGGLTLIALIATAGLTDVPINLSADPINVLYLFDMPLKMMFSGPTWLKIYALLFVNMTGIVMVVVIVFSAVLYFFAVLKAVAILMFSMVGIAVLVLMAPIFISMVLFKLTKDFFDRWWKYLLSFTLQPVAVFVMICIFNIMITIAMKIMLGFSVCPYCFFRIKLPNVEGLSSYTIDWCFFQAYAPFSNSFYSEAPEFELPDRVTEAMLFFVILALGMYQLTTVISEIMNRIVTGLLVNTFNLGSYADSAQNTLKGNAADIATGVQSGVGKIKNFGQRLQNIAAEDSKPPKGESPKNSEDPKPKPNEENK